MNFLPTFFLGNKGGVFYYATPIGFYANSDISQAAIIYDVNGVYLTDDDKSAIYSTINNRCNNHDTARLAVNCYNNTTMTCCT